LKKKSLGRPAASTNVRVVPEFRQEPDIEKLARTFIAIAEKSVGGRTRLPAAQKKAA